MPENNVATTILGISAFYHDSAAALIIDGEIVAAAQEERFTRQKHTADFPVNAIKYCLEYSGNSIDELDSVIFYDKPLLKMERLLETYYAFAPRGLKSFLTAIPVWIKEKMFLKKQILAGLGQVGNFDKKKLKLLFSEHHLSHAASAFYPSPFEEAAILTIDGVGEWATASICSGNGERIQLLKEMRFPHSVGLLYSAFTYYLGFKVNSGEYKLMGLAPYGNPEDADTVRFMKLIREHLVTIKEDGSIWLNQAYFNYATGLKMVKEKKWEQLFGFPPLRPEQKIEQHHCNLAFAIQKITEEIVTAMASEAKRLTGAKYLCLAGGVALNCVANGEVLRTGLFKDIFIQPAAGDAGGALGAALLTHHIYFGHKRRSEKDRDAMQGSFLGPSFSGKEITLTLKRQKAIYTKYEDFNGLFKDVAELINKGNIVGWFQGRMEYGPRALGNRSILGDPRNKEMQRKLNLNIKFRESFRPFAPSILMEKNKDFFELTVPSPYMLLTAGLKKDLRKTPPPDYKSMGIMEKLYSDRSDIQAVIHLDFSARIQTVHPDTNPRFWQLIKTFDQITGCPLVVNTSFNVRGEPIVCTPDDAFRCFMRSDMDFLVLEDFLLRKTDQPDWQNWDRWKVEFDLD